jgi:hypothetical protein
MRKRTLIRISLLLALVLALGTATACGHARHVGTRVTIGVGYFYDHLAVYGDWVLLEPYGWVWTPWDVGISWRPYTYGNWVYTVDGWTWVSAYPWGWAPFHYGRWLHHPNRGWVWIPGTEWAPAWVTWRYGPGTVGWAPLPPHAHWNASIGLQWDGNGLDVHAWSFVHDNDFLHLRLDQRLIDGDRHRDLFDRTHQVTRYEPGPRGIVGHGVPLADIERIHGTVPRLRLEDVKRPPAANRDRTSRDSLRIYRPDVHKAQPGVTPPKAKRKPGRGHG